MNQCRPAGNVLALMQRELDLGPRFRAAEQARLEAESGVVATPPVTETPSATEAEASAGTNAEASPDADAPTEAGGEEPS